MRDPKIEEAAQRAANGFQSAGKINVYRCQGASAFYPAGKPGGCGVPMITIDRETGVTPFITKCTNCGGEAQSSMYRVPPGLRPTHEWYRPDSLEGLPPHSRDHVLKGGLILRPIEGAAGHRQPKWQRFQGDLAQVAVSKPPPGSVGVPTIGVAPDHCPECKTNRVLIASIADSGHEVNVAVAPETALIIADQIRAAALEVIEAQGKA